MTDSSPQERFLNISAVVDRTSFSRATIYDFVKRGRFPKPIQISPNRVAWPSSVVSAWIASKITEAA